MTKPLRVLNCVSVTFDLHPVVDRVVDEVLRQQLTGCISRDELLRRLISDGLERVLAEDRKQIWKYAVDRTRVEIGR